jgi:rhodanese-related sulfurtransferase
MGDAKLIPVDEITKHAASGLPDMDHKILFYCQSGYRADNAAAKLVSMVYN